MPTITVVVVLSLWIVVVLRVLSVGLLGRYYRSSKKKLPNIWIYLSYMSYKYIQPI